MSFVPGPSQLTDETVDAICRVATSGFLSRSHRSDAFREICRDAILGLRKALGVPTSYRILLQPSATAAMEMVLRNLVKSSSFHFVHGAFSRRFYQTALDVGIAAMHVETDPQRAVGWRGFDVPADCDLLCVTHNETSTGLMWPDLELAHLRETFPDRLIAIDATSSLAGLNLPWTAGDLWFASVQKCLGLPSGLGLVIVNDRACRRARELELSRAWRPAGWQDINKVAEKMKDWQTPETPNMLAIALLAHQMRTWDMAAIDRSTRGKAARLYQESRLWTPFVKDCDWRSQTVLQLRVPQPAVLMERALRRGLVLGSGYGAYKQSCIRIANFPAHRAEDVKALLDALRVQ